VEETQNSLLGDYTGSSETSSSHVSIYSAVSSCSPSHSSEARRKAFVCIQPEVKSEVPKLWRRSSSKRPSICSLSQQCPINLTKSSAASQSAPKISNIKIKVRKSAQKKSKVKKNSRRRRKRVRDVFGDIVITSKILAHVKNRRNRDFEVQKNQHHMNRKLAVLQLQYDEQVKSANVGKKTITGLRREVRATKDKLRRLAEKMDVLLKQEILLEKNRYRLEEDIDSLNVRLVGKDKEICLLKEQLVNEKYENVTVPRLKQPSQKKKEICTTNQNSQLEGMGMVNKENVKTSEELKADALEGVGKEILTKTQDDDFRMLQNKNKKVMRELRANLTAVIKENELLRLNKQRTANSEEEMSGRLEQTTQLVKELKAEIQVLKTEKLRERPWFLPNQAVQIEKLNNEIQRLKHESLLDKRKNTFKQRHSYSKSGVQHLKLKIKELEGVIDNLNHDGLTSVITTSSTNNPNNEVHEKLIASLKNRLIEQKKDQVQKLRMVKQSTERAFGKLRAQNRKLKQNFRRVNSELVKPTNEYLVKKHACLEKNQGTSKNANDKLKVNNKLLRRVSRTKSESEAVKKKPSRTNIPRSSLTTGKVSKLKRAKVFMKPNHCRRDLKKSSQQKSFTKSDEDSSKEHVKLAEHMVSDCTESLKDVYIKR